MFPLSTRVVRRAHTRNWERIKNVFAHISYKLFQIQINVAQKKLLVHMGLTELYGTLLLVKELRVVYDVPCAHVAVLYNAFKSLSSKHD